RSFHAVFPEHIATDDRSVCTYRRPAAYLRSAESANAFDLGPGLEHIGEDAGVATEYDRPQLDAFIQLYRGLYLAVVAHGHIRTGHDVLPDRRISSNARAGQDVAEMPNLGSLAQLHILIQIGTFVHKGLARHPATALPKYWPRACSARSRTRSTA